MEDENSKEGKASGSVHSIVFPKLRKVLSSVVVAAFVILAILLGGARLLGFTPYAVLSPSMTPKYPVGCLVYVQKAEPEKIKDGEVITFVAGRNKTVVTHRVVRADPAERCFYTKGDANTDEDTSPVIYENVLGRVRFSVPWIGFLSMYIATAEGRYTAPAVLFLLCLILFVPDFVRLMKKKE